MPQIYKVKIINTLYHYFLQDIFQTKDHISELDIIDIAVVMS